MPMEAYRAGEALLRSSQPILAFLAPAVYRLPPTSRTAPAPISRYCRGSRHAPAHASRSFSTSQCRSQQQSDTPPPTRSSSVGDDISSLLDDSLDLNKGSTSSSSNPFSSRKKRIAEELQEAQGGRKRSSVDELLDSMIAQPTLRGGQSQYTSNTIMSMLNPNDGAPSAAIAEEKPVELPKNVGRMVEVNEARNIDVGRAFRSMEIQCARNRVRSDFQKQRYHERPGMKRKRLKRERWARRFKSNFVKTVQMVQRMNKQGW